MKKALKFLTVAVVVAVCFLWLQRPSLRVLKSWQQAVEINYKSHDPYFLNVVEDNWDLGHIPFSMKRNYFIYVGKEKIKITYGHVKNYSFEYHQDIQKYLETCQVAWTSDGVTFIEPSGHKLFIPVGSFSGGR